MKRDLQLIARLWPHAKPDAWVFLFAIIATPMIAALSLAQPWLLKRIIDEHVLEAQIDGLKELALLYLAAVGGAYLIEAAYTLAIAWGGQRLILRLRRALFSHALSLKQRFFDRQPAGKLLTRLTTDLDSLGDALSAGIVTILLDLLMIIGTIIAMVWLDWQLSVVMLMLTPLLLGVLEMIRRRMKRLYLAIRDAIAGINAYLAERIDGVEVIQLFGAGQQTRKAFDKRNRRFRDLTTRSNLYDALMYAVVDGVGAIFMAVILTVGTGMLMEAVGFGGTEARSAGLLVAFIDYMQRLFRPLRDASGKVAVIQRAAASLSKIDELFADAEPANPGEVALPTVEGHIQISDLWFRYTDDGSDVLKGVNLEVKPGEVVAIVGATGSGKTTLGRLLDKSYEGYRGSIKIDGIEVSELKSADLRRHVSAVRQDIQLFCGPLAFNVDLGNERISHTQRAHATTLVRAETLVERLGWTHILRERGADLSVGEGQLLTFARAMAHDPAVIIMDEATASIDSMTEQRIQTAIEALMTDKTAIVIAHRLSTIQHADHILVMDGGRIVERGSHAGLLAENGHYASLIRAGEAARLGKGSPST
jgi:ATP-binding cassette, subfamily B, multidrug efflux pump